MQVPLKKVDAYTCVGKRNILVLHIPFMWFSVGDGNMWEVGNKKGQYFSSLSFLGKGLGLGKT